MVNKISNILIVSSDKMIPEGLSRCLHQWGYAVSMVQDGASALEKIKAEKVDLVLLDGHIQNVDACQVLESMKDDESMGYIPAIMLLPVTELGDMERYTSVGAEDYLVIPFSTTMLKVLAHDYVELSCRRQDEFNRAKGESLLKIERDVEIARQIQLDFLPRELPRPEGWDIAARFHPARQVAGDWYDAFYMAGGRRVGFIVADVCDKGVGSALFMALFRSLIRAFAQQNLALRWMDTGSDDWLTSAATARRKELPSTGTSALKGAIEITNNYMYENHGQLNYFATVFFGMIDPATGAVTYVNGGHPPAMVLDKAGRVKERLKPTGPAVGVFPNVEFYTGQTILEPGDTLFAFSDGVTDARNPDGKLFTEKRLLAILEHDISSAVALLDRIEDTLHIHIATADPFDDITMMAVMHIAQPPETT